ncbi:MAG: hypothetical protein ABL961_11340 [Vicinamibacterales bacterium]
MTSRLLLVLVVATSLAGCSKATDTTPTTPAVTSPVTNSFTNRLPVGGAVARAFTTSTAGQISVQVNNTTPSATIGIGLGVPGSTNGIANCTLTMSVETSGATAPQISTGAAAGTYCVVAYDLGTLARAVDFDATIIYP